MAAAIAESLLHFIWQGTALGVLAYLLLRGVGDQPVARYAVGLGTLTAMVLAPLSTAFWLLSDAGPVVEAPRSLALVPGRTLPVAWVLGLWAAGVSLCTIRLTGGWILASRMATRVTAPVSREIEAMASRVAARLEVSAPFVVVESAIAASPILIGWLKPVILLPSAAIAGLTPSQLEALLAHELGHIRRHDYIVNLLQSAVETLLFFHPAVWLVSRQVREAREQCCDDLTVSVCDRLVYVSALSSVASLRAATPALAAGGGSLRNRVERILHPGPAASPSLVWLAVAPIALVLAAAMPVTGTPETTAPRIAAAEAHLDVPSIPASAPQVSRAPKPPRSITSAPKPEPLPMAPALPVVLNYFTVPVQAMDLQAPPPPPPPQPQQPVRPAAVTIQGQVLRPGKASLSLDQMTIIKAIAIAGGFSEMAGDIEIRRPGVEQAINITWSQIRAGHDLELIDGDTVLVRQRHVFFVNGEVNSPGQKVWAEGMTVQKAVQLSHGLTPQGKFGHIERPVKDATGKILRYVKIKLLKPETEILPGDQLVIARKWFGE